MLSFLPHPIRPRAWTVLSGSYRVGTIYDDSAHGDGWGWMINPDALQVSIAGGAKCLADAERMVREKWSEQIVGYGLEEGAAPELVRQTLRAEPCGTDYFLIMSNGRMVGDVEVNRAGRAGITADLFRWSVGDHPDERHRSGFTKSLEEAIIAAESGWCAWLAVAGLRTL